MKTIINIRRSLFTMTVAITIWSHPGLLFGQASQLLKDINPSGSSYPYDFKEFNGELYFVADNGTNGVELWVSDGTSGGTHMMTDLNPGTNGSFPSFLTEYNGLLYFSADNGPLGNEFWVTDGTPGGTQIISDINPGPNGSFPLFYTVFNGALYFSADDGVNGRELWTSNGTPAGTSMVANINPGGSSFPGHLTVYNGLLYFIANDGTNGFELWSSNGTPGGTQMVKDINTAGNSNPSNLVVYNGLLYFSANNGTHGNELWVTDGTFAGTQMVKDIHPGGSSTPKDFIEYNGLLYFSADDGSIGVELWVTDGTTTGTQMVADIHPGPNGSFPINFGIYDGLLYFAADNGVEGPELWVSDGSATGTQAFPFNLNPGPTGSFPGGFTIYEDILYFTAYNDVHGRQLWAADGNNAQMITPVSPPYTDALDNVFELKVFDGSLYYQAVYDTSIGTEPYKLTFSCAEPGNLSLVQVTENEANIEWDTSPDEFNGYEWRVMLDGDDPDIDTPVAVGVTSFGITAAIVTGLSGNTDYVFYVRTKCAAGIFMTTGAWAAISFTTQTLSTVSHMIPGFKFYPNPAIDVVYLTASTTIDKVVVYNLSGQKVLEHKAGNSQTQLQTGHLSTGMYILEVTANRQTARYKLLKK